VAQIGVRLKEKVCEKNQKLEMGKANRDFIPRNARDGAEVSHPQADAFAGANAEEKVGLLRSK